jgi:pimeloyl-ACP methyl ester carboxylesterase
VKLFFRKFGDGPPLIILHGLYGSSDNWISVAKSISGSFTTYIPDQRNHGFSPHSDVHDYDSMSNDIRELADELDLNKFFLAGHSMGGKTAISFALKWPERLSGLVVADISPFVPEHRITEAGNQITRILDAIISVNLSGITSRQEVESLLKPSIRSEAERSLIMKNLKRVTDNTFGWKINASSLQLNIGNILSGIQIKKDDNQVITGFPVFFLKGERSEYLPVNDFKRILEIFPAAELIIIPSAGHWLHVDNPAAVTKALLRLLD